jgi:hypothetical protein
MSGYVKTERRGHSFFLLPEWQKRGKPNLLTADEFIVQYGDRDRDELIDRELGISQKITSQREGQRT